MTTRPLSSTTSYYKEYGEGFQGNSTEEAYTGYHFRQQVQHHEAISMALSGVVVDLPCLQLMDEILPELYTENGKNQQALQAIWAATMVRVRERCQKEYPEMIRVIPQLDYKQADGLVLGPIQVVMKENMVLFTRIVRQELLAAEGIQKNMV